MSSFKSYFRDLCPATADLWFCGFSLKANADCLTPAQILSKHRVSHLWLWVPLDMKKDRKVEKRGGDEVNDRSELGSGFML